MKFVIILRNKQFPQVSLNKRQQQQQQDRICWKLICLNAMNFKRTLNIQENCNQINVATLQKYKSRHEYSFKTSFMERYNLCNII